MYFKINFIFSSLFIFIIIMFSFCNKKIRINANFYYIALKMLNF